MRIGGCEETLETEDDKMLQVNWVKCGDDGHWYSLVNLDLSKDRGGGVYVIWHEGDPGKVVRIGQGDIVSRLNAHRKDKEILAYAKTGTLRVTWAVVPKAQRDGVERYLADYYGPLVGDAFPDAKPIAVNLVA